MTTLSSCASGALPDELAAWVGAAQDALEVTRRAGEWDPPTRQRTLAALQRVVNLVAVGKARVVTAEAEAGTWGRKGDRDMAGFLGRESHQGRSAGSAAVGQAATLSAMPAVADALVDGPVTVTHVEQITRAASSSPALAAELATPTGQARLVELARRYDGAAFGKQLRVLGAAVDPVRRQREHEQQRADRFVEVSHGANGTYLKGFLDSVSGYRVVKALEAFDPRPAADDDRDARQRRADALVSLADHVLREPTTAPGAVAPPQVIVTVSEETWVALRGGRGRNDRRRRDNADASIATGGTGVPGVPAAGGVASVPASAGATVEVVAALQGRTAVVDEDGNAWPASEIARLLCECSLTRVVLGAESQALDLGYKERCFDRRHWKALLAAGWRTCAYPGCSMPLRWCQLHHLTWWSRDGRTDRDNCAPYCCYHHGVIHDRDLRIRRLPDGSFEHCRPDGALVGVSHPGGVVSPGGVAAVEGTTARRGGAPPHRGSTGGGATGGGSPDDRTSSGDPPDSGSPDDRTSSGDPLDSGSPDDRTSSGDPPDGGSPVAASSGRWVPEQPALWRA